MRHAAPMMDRPVRGGAGRVVSLKLLLLCGLALVLTVVVVFASTREASLTETRSQPPASVRPNIMAPRPALSAEEQQYVESLWPIHTEVERAAVRLALGTAFYRLNDVDRAELKTRLDQAARVFGDADERIKALAPPPSLQHAHLGYLEAVRLFQGSAVEMLKMFEDGNEAHLVTGFPLSQQGSDKIREVGSQLFPDEYPPN